MSQIVTVHVQFAIYGESATHSNSGETVFLEEKTKKNEERLSKEVHNLFQENQEKLAGLGKKLKEPTSAKALKNLDQASFYWVTCKAKREFFHVWFIIHTDYLSYHQRVLLIGIELHEVVQRLRFGAGEILGFGVDIWIVQLKDVRRMSEMM
ncbi:hypothetical protein POM88_004840 [Heracleum sosnowskyi]|uniref:Uncharacterized protein n=1 Tax=Heracleum sosnowskyi TaxID=360622 RepID=A0AAD8JNT1_9APIA|nr:hypothetical protein POM88_004840 [Heracleum sosnowskyi]